MRIQIPHTAIDSVTARRVRAALASAGTLKVPDEIKSLRVEYRPPGGRSHKLEVARAQTIANADNPLNYTLTLNGSPDPATQAGIDTGVDEATAIQLQRLLGT